jgi:hypothetical protein
MLSGLPDPLVTSTDPDPTSDPSIIKQKIARKTLISTVLSLLLSLKNDVYTSVPHPFVSRPPKSASGSFSQRFGSEDPHLDLYQNFTVP